MSHAKCCSVQMWFYISFSRLCVRFCHQQVVVVLYYTFYWENLLATTITAFVHKTMNSRFFVCYKINTNTFTVYVYSASYLCVFYWCSIDTRWWSLHVFPKWEKSVNKTNLNTKHSRVRAYIFMQFLFGACTHFYFWTPKRALSRCDISKKKKLHTTNPCKLLEFVY